MEKIFYPLLEASGADAIIVHCSDPRFQEAFKSFVKNELKIQHPAYIVVPGSVSSVGAELFAPKHLKTLKDQIEFMLKHAKQPRLIIINHDDCQMYGKIHNLVCKKISISEHQINDLKKAVELFKKYVPAANNIEIFMARLDQSQPKKVFFEKIV
ncbi:hypothetical protein JW977_03635 [Candidatus Falkowbacteria bacterium]|nr:hypothetical protein [Candidatus Falkowbacteria bacterium]